MSYHQSKEQAPFAWHHGRRKLESPGSSSGHMLRWLAKYTGNWHCKRFYETATEVCGYHTTGIPPLRTPTAVGCSLAENQLPWSPHSLSVIPLLPVWVCQDNNPRGSGTKEILWRDGEAQILCCTTQCLLIPHLPATKLTVFRTELSCFVFFQPRQMWQQDLNLSAYFISPQVFLCADSTCEDLLSWTNQHSALCKEEMWEAVPRQVQ